MPAKKIEQTSSPLQVRPIYLKLLLLAVFILLSALAGQLNLAKAGDLLDVTATLSTSRLSYIGSLNGSAQNLSTITVEAEGTYDDDDDDTDQFVVGDTITVLDDTDGSTTETANIEEVVDGDEIKIDSPLTSVYDDGDNVYLIKRADVTIGYTTTSQIAGSVSQDTSAGHFRVLIPAINGDNADDYPDAGYFDFGSGTAATVTCPTDDGTDHDFPASGTATADNYTDGSGNHWHTFTCGYNGNGRDGATFTDFTISNLIMPAPIQSGASEHDTGVADTYSIIIQHLSDATTVVNTTTVKVGAIEAVQVSATVVPSLSFTITGLTTGDTVCGTNPDVATTANTVPLGELSTGSFTLAGQTLTVTTNAVDGATVTAVANDQLGLNGATCTGDTYNSTYNCIWDADVTSMTHEDDSGTAGEQDWDAESSKAGFAFSLDDSDGDSNPQFYYNESGTFDARHFADAENSQDPQTLFDTNSQPTNDDDVIVCYRAKADALTSAGDYYNYITYTATAQF